MERLCSELQLPRLDDESPPPGCWVVWGEARELEERKGSRGRECQKHPPRLVLSELLSCNLAAARRGPHAQPQGGHLASAAGIRGGRTQAPG